MGKSKEALIEDRGAVATNPNYDPTAGETATVETVIALDADQILNLRDGFGLIACALTEDYVGRDGEVKNGMDFSQKVILGRIIDGFTFALKSALRYEAKAELDHDHARRCHEADVVTLAQVKRAQATFERAKDRRTMMERMRNEALEAFKVIRGEDYVPYEKKEAGE